MCTLIGIYLHVYDDEYCKKKPQENKHAPRNAKLHINL